MEIGASSDRERQLDRLFRALPAGVLLLDAGRRIVMTNERADEMLPLLDVGRGAAIDEIRGVSVDDLIAQAGSASDVVVEGPPQRVLSVSASRAGIDAETIVVIRDVTEERDRQARSGQQERLALIGQLAGGIAHDFNNLLAIILNYADFVSPQLTDQQVRDDVGEIRSAARRAADLTKQLLAISRRELVAPRVFDVNKLVGEVAKLVLCTLGERVKVDVALSASAPSVKADPSRIEQVLLNVVSNARDAMAGGGTLHLVTDVVELDAEAARRHEVPPGDYALIAVRDTGTGMDPETAARVFEPFFTTKERGKGTGLGLASAYGIVKQAGGHIWVESRPGEGATFSVVLPRSSERPAVERSSGRKAAAKGEATILMVDDEPAVFALVSRILTKAGYKVIGARGGEEALAKLAEHRGIVHLLLTDLVMPGMSGKQLAERVVELRPGIRVLYMSGFTDHDVAGRGLHRRAKTVLPKPFTRDELLRRVMESLAEGDGGPRARW